MTTQKEDKLLILLVSDIHESIESINKLAAYCQENSINADYIFCLGDILDITQDSQEDQALYEEKLPILKNILLSLEKICPKLIYLPGNHDPMNLFKVENSPKITENSINLHLKSHMIKDDLLLVGIGGATCSIYSENELYHTYKNLKRSVNENTKRTQKEKKINIELNKEKNKSPAI